MKETDGAPSAELRLQLDAPHLAVFSGAAQLDLPELGPVRGEAILELEGRRIGVTDLELHAGNEHEAWLHLTGYAKDLVRRRHFSLQADFGFEDVRTLGPLVGNPPPIGAVEGRARVSDRDDKPGIDEFHVKGGRPGVFEIDAEGHFEDLEGVHGLDARIDLEARDPAVIGELLRHELPAVGPVEFTGKVSAQAGVLETQHVRARIDQTHFTGALSGRFASAQRPRLTGHVDVPDLHLDDLGLSPKDTGAAAIPGAGATPARLFSDAPFELGRLDFADVQASVHVDRVLGVKGPLLRDVRLDVSLKGGWLSSRHVGHTPSGGALQSQLDFDSTVSPPTLDLDAQLKGLDLGNVVAQIDVHGAYSGDVDARLDLHSRGASPHELAANLGGEATLFAGPGTIATAHARLLTRDLIHAVR